jgi:hypothetical protein
LIEHGVDFRHEVLAIHYDGRICWRSQGHVQYRAVFGDVNLPPTKHRVDALVQGGLLHQLHEEFESLVGDAILGVIQEKARCLAGETLATFVVSREEVAQMESLDLVVMDGKGLPSGPFGQ